MIQSDEHIFQMGGEKPPTSDLCEAFHKPMLELLEAKRENSPPNPSKTWPQGSQANNHH